MRTVEVAGRGDIEVRGVQYDSRKVSAGDVFVAMRGGTTDGNEFIDAAIRKGAAAVVTDSLEKFVDLRTQQPELALALVDREANGGRRALAEISSAVFGAPEKRLKVSAVTGTNGKTTTAFLLEQMLKSVGRKCLLLGTIETHVGDVVRESEHTTPESRDVLALFAEGVRAGCTEVVMEMSSHALEQERVWGIPVDVAMFTNLTQDHLDYHGTMGKYAAAKARLFEGVGTGAPRVSVINADDAYGSTMKDAAAGVETVWTYGHRVEADFLARNVVLSALGATFDLVTPDGMREVRSPLFGWFNVDNLIAAMAAAIACGLTLDEAVRCAATIRSAPGRFEPVPNELGITVVVDYAHTDDALENVIGFARRLVGEGRVITMFGCGGDRDKTKRPKMGRVAAQGSDLVVVTSDNPRSENPMTIIEEILVGVRETEVECVVEVDRRVAIEVAIRAARAGDIVLLAGKGHEKTQTFAGGVVAFDDVAEAERVLLAIKAGVRT
ncbi:UDP-N-acetylmuramoyl-L-alanyl-D-glutamate--2,6-diaminopimelate ligase [Granulicella sp. L46]|uniref:UDP-N-acetylmuramoyl-L-alanyl-D-glutamate--2, 6-diaminopimelate ligase n=1 Tax=Granulicella sp. L46 TaxID=1641865 RepID=UPI0020B159E1|nr:UDP-N-acetylmuramoyl-L-alanyl-D-glutamate--2,6-diaminopimelate ligase [Granulicella sp. L46]